MAGTYDSFDSAGEYLDLRCEEMIRAAAAARVPAERYQVVMLEHGEIVAEAVMSRKAFGVFQKQLDGRPELTCDFVISRLTGTDAVVEQVWRPL